MSALGDLKTVKNRVIGNPRAKDTIARDESFIRRLVASLGDATVQVRTEAAHIVTSLSYGSQAALSALLRFGVLRALVFAMSIFNPSDPLSLRAAYARSLRALVSSTADVMGPSEYGLRPETHSTIRQEAKDALDYIFHIDTLDTLLPLLLSPSPQLTTPIVQLIASATRSSKYRALLASWLPPNKRKKEKGKVRKRGWENVCPVGPPTGSAAGFGASWTVRVLVALLSSTREDKLREAVLLSLAALAKENVPVALSLARGSWYHPDIIGPPLVLIHSLAKSRNVDVQLAACLCATHIVRACNPALNSNSYSYTQSTFSQHPLDDACVRAVLNMVNRVLAEGSGEAVEKRIKGCYILYHLTTDDRALCQLAFERGCLDTLAGVVKGTTPAETVEGWDENEAENTARLREASLTAVATLALFSNGIRRAVTDTHGLLPYISTALKQGISTTTNTNATTTPRHASTRSRTSIIATGNTNWNAAGVRYAGCQCVRVLARAVSVLRTNIVDSGLGMEVFRIVERGAGGLVDGGIGVEKMMSSSAVDEVEEVDEQRTAMMLGAGGEDRRVLNAALAAVCNIVMEFSPLRPIYLEQGLMPRLVQILRSGDGALRLNALWAVKNLLWKTSTETKRDVMSQLGWGRLYELLHDGDLTIQEQAYQIVRNLAESEEGIEMVFSQMGGDAVLDSITEAISLEDDDINSLAATTPISHPSPLASSVAVTASSQATALPSCLFPSLPSSSSPSLAAQVPVVPMVIQLQDRTPTITQAIHALANVCNAPHHLTATILEKPRLLLNLRTCLAECGSEVRRGAVACVLALARQHPKGRRALVEAGVVGTLRRLCEWVPGPSSSVGMMVQPAVVTPSGGDGTMTMAMRDGTTGSVVPWTYMSGSTGAVHPQAHHHQYGATGVGVNGRASRSSSRSLSVSGAAAVSPHPATVAGGQLYESWETMDGAGRSPTWYVRGAPTGAYPYWGAEAGAGVVYEDAHTANPPLAGSSRGGSVGPSASASGGGRQRPSTGSSTGAPIISPYPTMGEEEEEEALTISATTLAAAAVAGVSPPPGYQVQLIANLYGGDHRNQHQLFSGVLMQEQQQTMNSQQQQQQYRAYGQRLVHGGMMQQQDDFYHVAPTAGAGAGAGVVFGGGGGGGGGGNPALDVDKEVYDNARRTLDWLEHGDGYGV